MLSQLLAKLEFYLLTPALGRAISRLKEGDMDRSLTKIHHSESSEIWEREIDGRQGDCYYSPDEN